MKIDDITPGMAVRLSDGFHPKQRRSTFTVRDVNPDGVLVDNGDPGNSDLSTNGFAVTARRDAAMMEPWGDVPRFYQSGAVRAAEVRRRERVALRPPQPARDGAEEQP